MRPIPVDKMYQFLKSFTIFPGCGHVPQKVFIYNVYVHNQVHVRTPPI
jgi:hypothetical protein